MRVIIVHWKILLSPQGIKILADITRGPEQRTDQGQAEAVPGRVQLRYRDWTGQRDQRRKSRELHLFGVPVPVSEHPKVAAAEYESSSGLCWILIAVVLRFILLCHTHFVHIIRPYGLGKPKSNLNHMYHMVVPKVHN